jgi:8-oxo-dGTP pyrophosphatase MutT (NUDIX family)
MTKEIEDRRSFLLQIQSFEYRISTQNPTPKTQNLLKSLLNQESAPLICLILQIQLDNMIPKPSSFPTRLKQQLSHGLPGISSQEKMVPATRRKEILNNKGYLNGRKAAVLICFYPDHHHNIRLVLIKRNVYDGVHSGQISFPGGKYEQEDTDLVQTALREAMEETGIDRHKVELIGKLSTIYIPPSNYVVQPVLGWLSNEPEFVPEAAEVSEILRIPLSEFSNPGNVQEKEIIHRNSQKMMVPCYYIQGHIIWGATAMMLSEMIDVLRC